MTQTELASILKPGQAGETDWDAGTRPARLSEERPPPSSKKIASPGQTATIPRPNGGRLEPAIVPQYNLQPAGKSKTAELEGKENGRSQDAVPRLLSGIMLTARPSRVVLTPAAGLLYWSSTMMQLFCNASS